jgi:hypothetical protein
MPIATGPPTDGTCQRTGPAGDIEHPVPRRDHGNVEQDLSPLREHRWNEVPLVLVRNGFRRECCGTITAIT